MEYGIKFVYPTAYVEILAALHGTGLVNGGEVAKDAYALQCLSAANAKAADCDETAVTVRDMIDELRVYYPKSDRHRMATQAAHNLIKIGQNVYPWDIDLDSMQKLMRMLSECLSLATHK